MVAMNAETYAKDVARSEPRRLPDLRLDLAALGAAQARRHHDPRRAARASICNENFVGVRNRILMKNIMYARPARRAARNRRRRHARSCSTESYRQEVALVDANMKAVQLGYDYAKAAPARVRCRCASQRMDKTAGHIMIDGNTAAGLGARVRRRDRRSRGIRSRRRRR